MEISCLSYGKGYYFPSCHILDICGFRVLFDCPMDFTSLSIFHPMPMVSIAKSKDEKATCYCANYVGTNASAFETPRLEETMDKLGLIHAQPYYKFVKDLLLWDVSFIDIVLISSPMGMMGLPFLTRNKHFSAKVYATEASSKIGQYMMEDLVSMHMEYKQFHGPENYATLQWMKWDALECLPSKLRQVALGADGGQFSGWTPLYSAADIKDCMQKVEPLKYAEEICYNGTLIIKAFSSGLEIGSCNWSISSPKGNLAYVSNSVFSSSVAMSFNFKALQRHDVTMFSDVSAFNAVENFEAGKNCSDPGNTLSNSSDDNDSEASEMFYSVNECSEDMEKLDYLCSCSMDSVNAGGSVLIPIGRIGIILLLLERFSLALEYENMKVPIFVVSSVVEELVAFTNVIPEWLCKQRQDHLYSGQPLFSHVDMLKEGKLHLFSAIHSPKLLLTWQEPCIVFCPHWSLRLGPAVHLLGRWCRDKNSLLVMEEGLDSDLALLPFKPLEMKILQCSFDSGIPLRKYLHLLRNLQPKQVLFPEMLRQYVSQWEALFSFGYYTENAMLCVPNANKDWQLNISVELASQLRYTTLVKRDMNFARLKGELVIERGKHRLSLGKEGGSSQTSPGLLYCRGETDLVALCMALQKIGLNVIQGNETGHGASDSARVLHISEPSKATIEVTEVQTLICADNENLASLISETIVSMFDCL